MYFESIDKNKVRATFTVEDIQDMGYDVKALYTDNIDIIEDFFEDAIQMTREQLNIRLQGAIRI